MRKKRGKMVEKPFKSIIWSKTVIAESEAVDFYTAMGDALSDIEEAGQRYGWSRVAATEIDSGPPEIP